MSSTVFEKSAPYGASADSAPYGASVAGAEPAASFPVFLWIWFGQLLSVVGSGLTGFALGVWVYQRTGSVTQFALISLFTTLPGIVLSPLAGALVDRWDRRRAMILADLGAALATAAIALLLYFGRLPLWFLYLAMTASSIFVSLQWPAFTAATTLLVPKRHLARSAALRNLSQSAATLAAPILGGVLLLAIHIYGVLLVDFASFLVSVLILLFVRIPSPAKGAETAVAGERAGGSLFREAAYGWRYVRERPGLFALLLLAAFSNLALGLVQVLAAPMVLAFATASALGTALSIAGAGMLVGSLVMSVWRGPRRRIDGTLLFMVVVGLFIAAAGLRPSLPLFATAAFLFYFTFAVSGACGQALWQVKVAPEVQGRVFAIRRMVGWSTFPLAYLCAGPLADRLFEPALAPGRPLAHLLGGLFGIGRGRGIGVLLSLTGLFLALVSAAAYLFPRLQRIEEELPDTIND
jgi:MFS family permease